MITFVPRISVILANMAEAYKFTNVYQSSTSKRPCGICLVSKDDLNNTELLDIIPRTPQNMKQVIDNNQTHENSIHTKSNIFWKIKDFNIYQVTVPD